MQGSYKNNGLPRPYYMKPSKRGSVYDKMPKQLFLTNSRKLTGYIVLLFLFGLCIFLVSQELKTPGDVDYELVGSGRKIDKNSGNVGKFVESEKFEGIENAKQDLASNRVQNANGEYGRAVMEAPKGGMANEAHIVGNDEDRIVDGKIKKGSQEAPAKGKGFKAERNEETSQTGSTSGSKLKEGEAKEEKKTIEEGSEKSEKPLKKASNVKKILEESEEQ